MKQGSNMCKNILYTKQNRILWVLLLLCSTMFVYSQEIEPPQKAEQLQEKKQTSSVLITFGPLGILNTYKNSAPSPINFSIGGGAQISLLDFLSITPHLSFFGNYYLWENGQAYPAEIEHRSAYVPSFILDIPATYDLKTENSIFRIGLGASFLMRFAVLATSVPTTVQVDIDNMNKWFWQNAEFFYPSAQFSWDYFLDNGMALGLGLKAYVPVGSLIKAQGINNGMATITVRLIPPKFK